jgi:hypothetical protein
MTSQSNRFNRSNDPPPDDEGAPGDAAASPQGGDEPVKVSEELVLGVLRDGRLEERGLLPYSSNHSFLALVHGDELTVPAVYKPQRGESPLWDFEWGTLCKRETAAYVISHALDWNLVPPTVLRAGTRGLGSVQFFVDHDADAHYFTVQADARYAGQLRQLVLFDYIANNADRKSGHCLVGSDQRLWAIDHGICFHTEYKLRTVIWEFSDEPIAPELLEDLEHLRRELADERSQLALQLCALLSEAERRTLVSRVNSLVRSARFPSPPPHRRNYPWPPV